MLGPGTCFNENTIPFSPSLAMNVGLNAALFLQQLHYRLNASKNIRDGHKWVFNTYDD
ncbi:hypothetical protein [Sporosarcina sp. P19]|uniref:hypothetical protein n=1 Tax=Sporosarcina sp. P19 TaxID=2048258 RepID=UPI0013040988|nr:hypothetical protein [Sporosarcina sp. P19]